MSGNASIAAEALNRRFLLDYPWDAARRIEEMVPAELVPALAGQTVQVLAPVWQRLSPNIAAPLLEVLPQVLASELLAALPPNDSVRILGVMDEPVREQFLDRLAREVQHELRGLLSYPEDSAGRLMDTRIQVFRGEMRASEALATLRRSRAKTARSLYLIDDENKLTSKVAIQDIAVAEPEQDLAALAQPLTAAVSAVAPQSEVAELLERYRLADLPVIDAHGQLIGIIYHATLVHAIQEDVTADLQTMVGASKEERALSRPLFAVKKRLPWLQINLLTAFLAAAVVGLFEDTIARFTALAVLLPVVAGQSGNAGAQALAVTMRGLALREITVRHWFQVTLKEVSAGMMSGVAIAITCGLGVLLWSGSLGLVLVIALSMVLAMIAAGFAGALVPIVLTRLGQDPAVASSIILTTVTDIAGFFSFLGIATALASLL